MKKNEVKAQLKIIQLGFNIKLSVMHKINFL